MSDQQVGKKIVEEHGLGFFLAAYEDATGERLEVLGSSERPDFLCRRENGDPVGELTSVSRDPESGVAHRILSNDEFADPDQTLAKIAAAIAPCERGSARRGHRV
jgi:hypothetical protein